MLGISNGQEDSAAGEPDGIHSVAFISKSKVLGRS